MTGGDFFHLFTYGTLFSGAGAGDAGGDGRAGREGLLAGCARVGDGVVAGTLYDLGPYPALLIAGTQRVHGEIWRCPVDRLAALDRYEGTREGLFRRAAVRVGDVACWVYVAGPRLGPRLTPSARLESGRWSERRTTRHL